MKVLEYLFGSSLGKNREEEKFFLSAQKQMFVDLNIAKHVFPSFILPFEKNFTNINTGQ